MNLPKNRWVKDGRQSVANSLWYDCTKPGSCDPDSCVGFSADLSNFVTNVFAFSITVGPDHQLVHISRLVFNIPNEFTDSLRVFDHYGRVEQHKGITRGPFAICVREVDLCNVTRDISYGKGFICLRVIKAVVACPSVSDLQHLHEWRTNHWCEGA